AAIVQIVVVEMDRAVMFGLVGPVVFAAVPAPALHSSGGKIYRFPVMSVAGDIDDSRRRYLEAEIPGRNQGFSWFRCHRVPDEPTLFGFPKRTRRNGGLFDLPVEMAARRGTGNPVGRTGPGGDAEAGACSGGDV